MSGIVNDNKRVDAEFIENRNPIKRVESQDEANGIAALEGHGLVKSRFDTLPLWQTVWAFRRAILYALAYSTTGIFEGFELSMSGSIIVNKGFVQQFGEPQPDGTKKVNTTWSE